MLPRLSMGIEIMRISSRLVGPGPNSVVCHIDTVPDATPYSPFRHGIDPADRFTVVP